MGCNRATVPGGGTPLPPGTLIAVIGPTQTHPNWRGIRGGAERYAAERGYLECLTAAPRSDDPAALTAVVDEVLWRDPLAACLVVENPALVTPVARRIAGRGILLVTIGKPLDDVDVYGHLEVNWAAGAEVLGSQLDAIGGGRLSYVLLHENGLDRSASNCYARFCAAARARSALTLLTERDAAESDDSPDALVRELLARFPHVGLVVTLSPRPWLSLRPPIRPGVASHPTDTHAATQPARTPPTRFATLGAPPVLWSRLRSGAAAALVGPLDGEVGYAAVEMAVQGLMHVPDAPRRRTVRCELVTAATLDDFAKRYAAAAGVADPATLIGEEAGLEPASRPNGH